MESWSSRFQPSTAYNHLDYREDNNRDNNALQDLSYHSNSTPSNNIHDTNTPLFSKASSKHSTGPFSPWKSRGLDQFLIVSATLVPLAIGIYLLMTTIRDERPTGPLLSFVVQNRATAQIIVSIISALLAWLNIYTATTLLNLATRIYLLRHPLSLNTIKFIGAITSTRFVTGVSKVMSTASLIMVLLFAIPNILWTGTLTPILTDTTVTAVDGLKIPRYSPMTNMTWANNTKNSRSGCTILSDTKGVFSDCPVVTSQSELISRAAEASGDLNRTHSKADNSHYSYNGRSYGVGSSVGLVDGIVQGQTLLRYNYTEPGYLASVKCFHNATLNWHLQEIQPGKPVNGIPNVYYAIGQFPNGGTEHPYDFYSVVGLKGDKDIVAMAAKSYYGRHLILITAGNNYLPLNGTQCEVSFKPTKFAVAVDVLNKTITVSATSAVVDKSFFDPSTGLSQNVIRQLNYLGMISTTLYTSVIGDALMANIATASNNMDGLGDSFSAMIDELLLAIGSSQLFLQTPNGTAGDFSTTNAQLVIKAVRLGEARYVMPISAVCLLLLIAVMVEAWRTKAWKNLPKWDFTDMTCVVLASAVSGDDIIDELSKGQNAMEMNWTGDGSGEWWRSGRFGSSEMMNEEVPGWIRLRLGRRIENIVALGETKRASISKERDIQLSAVSLWTSNAKGIESLL